MSANASTRDVLMARGTDVLQSTLYASVDQGACGASRPR